VKRILACVSLLFVSAGCFWIVFSAMNEPLPFAHRSRAANSTNADGTGSGLPLGPATNLAASSGGAPNSLRPSSVLNSSMTNTSVGVLSCQNRCQASGASCQVDCYQHYNVTDQTQYWNRCMQSCGNSLSLCSNNCVSGVSLPAIPSVWPPPSLPPVSQPRTRSPPPLQTDQPSSSSSQSR
jgi:hypothetical protein